jgi:hypothetical protein
MTLEDLLNATKENYELAMKDGCEYRISNVIRGYETLSNLYHLGMITAKTFNKYFDDIYTMANNVYIRYVRNDEEMIKKVKSIVRRAPFSL